MGRARIKYVGQYQPSVIYNGRLVPHAIARDTQRIYLSMTSPMRVRSDETSAEDEEKEAVVVVVKESQVRAFCDHAVARFFKM